MNLPRHSFCGLLNGRTHFYVTNSWRVAGSSSPRTPSVHISLGQVLNVCCTEEKDPAVSTTAGINQGGRPVESYKSHSIERGMCVCVCVELPFKVEVSSTCLRPAPPLCLCRLSITIFLSLYSQLHVSPTHGETPRGFYALRLFLIRFLLYLFGRHCSHVNLIHLYRHKNA